MRLRHDLGGGLKKQFCLLDSLCKVDSLLIRLQFREKSIFFEITSLGTKEEENLESLRSHLEQTLNNSQKFDQIFAKVFRRKQTRQSQEALLT
jgi:alanine racemase